jgi:hypothetical protein
MKFYQDRTYPIQGYGEWSATYMFNEFCETITKIIEIEVEEWQQPFRLELYSHNPDNKKNPNDHQDHYVTGMVVKQLIDQKRIDRLYSFTVFDAYEIRNRPENIVTGLGRFAHWQLYWKYAEHVLSNANGVITRKDCQVEWKNWGYRQYSNIMEPGRQ